MVTSVSSPRESAPRFKDIKPYEAPESVTDLHGPREGKLRLPSWVYWGPGESFDLAVDGDVVAAYQALLQEASAEEQSAMLNADLLVEVWARLSLPERVRRLWEGRFPLLANA